jgi:hypothetical protein
LAGKPCTVSFDFHVGNGTGEEMRMRSALKDILLVLAAAVALGTTTARAGDSAADAIAKAEGDLAAAVSAGAVWRLVDKSSGSSAVGIDKLLKTAKKKLEDGDGSEALRIASRVSWAAQAGITQATAQKDAVPFY